MLRACLAFRFSCLFFFCLFQLQCVYWEKFSRTSRRSLTSVLVSWTSHATWRWLSAQKFCHLTNDEKYSTLNLVVYSVLRSKDTRKAGYLVYFVASGMYCLLKSSLMCSSCTTQEQFNVQFMYNRGYNNTEITITWL